MFPLWINNQEDFYALKNAYTDLPWYKKLFFPSALKKVLASSTGFNTPQTLWDLYNAYFNHPGWFGRYFRCIKDFAAVDTTRLLAPLAQAALLTGIRGKMNFNVLMSDEKNERRHIVFILSHYPHLFRDALDAQNDFNRIFLTYKEELMFGSLMAGIVSFGLSHQEEIGHALNPLNPQGKGAVWLHEIYQWCFVNPLYRSHIDGIMYARQANNKEQITHHVDALLKALKGHDLALASLAMIMDAKVDRLTQIVLEEHQALRVEQRANALVKMEENISNFNTGMDSDDYIYKCWTALTAFKRPMGKLSRIYTGNEQKDTWGKIRTGLLNTIERLANHKNYSILRNEPEFNGQPINLPAFARLLRRMVAEDWVNRPEKNELVRQSQLLVHAVSVLATVDASFTGLQNKHSVIQHKFFQIVFDLIDGYENDAQQKDKVRQATNQALTKEACTYLYGLALDSASFDELKEQVLPLYVPFASSARVTEELPQTPYDSVLQTYHGDTTHQFDYLLRAIDQTTTDGASNTDTGLLLQMIDQRINLLTNTLDHPAFSIAFANKYTPEIHSRLSNQLNPKYPYVSLVAAYGALHLATKAPIEKKNRYVAQALQQMTLLKRHMPYPVNDALTQHHLWKLVLTLCQEQTAPLYQAVKGQDARIMSQQELGNIERQLLLPTLSKEHPKKLYYEALFFKQCQVLAADYQKYIAKLSITNLKDEHFSDATASPSIPFTLQDSRHIRRQIETYYQGNEERYFYGLAKATYPLNVQAIKTKLKISNFSTGVTKSQAHQYIAQIKKPSEVNAEACQAHGVLSEDGQQKITAINEPDYLLLMDYPLLHPSHLLEDVYQKIKTTNQPQSYELLFNHLLKAGYMPLPLSLLEEELQSTVLPNPQATKCLLASLTKVVENYHIDSQHPLFVPSLPPFKKIINQSERLLKGYKEKEALKKEKEVLKPKDRKLLLQLITELHTLEQSINSQGAYLRSRSLTTNAQAHLPLGNETLRTTVYHFLADKPSSIIKGTVFAHKELNEVLGSLHADINLETLSHCIGYVMRYPQWGFKQKTPPTLGVGSQSYQEIRKAYGEIPIQDIINKLVKQLDAHGGAELFDVMRSELNDNAEGFADIIQALSSSDVQHCFDPEIYAWAPHVERLSCYYRSQHTTVKLGEKSNEGSNALNDIAVLWKKQPWQKKYGFAQTPKLEPHVQEVLRMQALLLFCYQKAPYFYSPYNLHYEAYNGVKDGVVGFVTAPYKIIRHPIDTATDFQRTFFTKQGLINLGMTFYNHPVRMSANLITVGGAGAALGYGGCMLWKASLATATPPSLLGMHAPVPLAAHGVAVPTVVSSTTATTTTLVQSSKEETLEQQSQSLTQGPVSPAHTNNLRFFKPQETNYFVKHWTVASQEASWFKTAQTRKLDQAFAEHAKVKPRSEKADRKLMSSMDEWLEAKKDSNSSRYDLVVAMREQLKEVIENAYTSTLASSHTL